MDGNSKSSLQTIIQLSRRSVYKPFLNRDYPPWISADSGHFHVKKAVHKLAARAVLPVFAPTSLVRMEQRGCSEASGPTPRSRVRWGDLLFECLDLLLVQMQRLRLLLNNRVTLTQGVFPLGNPSQKLLGQRGIKLC